MTAVMLVLTSGRPPYLLAMPIWPHPRVVMREDDLGYVAYIHTLHGKCVVLPAAEAADTANTRATERLVRMKLTKDGVFYKFCLGWKAYVEHLRQGFCIMRR